MVRENLKGAEKKLTLQKHPFGQPFLRTTPSPLLWRALKNFISASFWGGGHHTIRDSKKVTPRGLQGQRQSDSKMTLTKVIFGVILEALLKRKHFGTNATPPWNKSGNLFNSTVKSPFCPVCRWDGLGFVPGTIVPQRAVRKMVVHIPRK